MSADAEITAGQWLAVRERVVGKLSTASPRSEKGTRVRMAEALIGAGYIDVDFIAAEIQAEKIQREEALQSARAAHERNKAEAPKEATS